MKKILITAIKILLFFFSWAIFGGLIEIPSEDPVLWRFYAELVPLAVILFFTIIFLLIEKGKVRIPIKENIVRGTLVGTLSGIVWIGLAFGILYLFGTLRITGQNEVSKLWLWIISASINVIMQELLVRGYIYRLLKEKYNLPAAVIFTTCLFTLMHGGAFEAGILAVLNVVTMCLFTTALYESEKTLLAPIMAHAIWNVVGSLILGSVSLASDYPHLLNTESFGNKILSGGVYKIEGSIVVTVLNVGLMVLFFCLWRKRAGHHTTSESDTNAEVINGIEKNNG